MFWGGGGSFTPASIRVWRASHRMGLPCHFRNQCTSRARVLRWSRLGPRQARIDGQRDHPNVHVPGQLAATFFSMNLSRPFILFDAAATVTFATDFLLYALF